MKEKKPQMCDMYINPFKVSFNGTWIIEKNIPMLGYDNWIDISEYIPDDLRTKKMDTFKDYQKWGLNPVTHQEEEITIFKGLHAYEWIKKNEYWIFKICSSNLECLQLYEQINAADWD